MPFHAYNNIHRLFHQYDVMLAIVDAGTACWFVVYVLAILYGRKHNSYAIPLVSVVLNSSWEAMAAFVWVAPQPLWHLGDIVWFGLDLVIVWQLLTHGRRRQHIAEMERWYYWVLAGSFGLALACHDTFARFAADTLGFADSYIVNLVMSILFIHMHFVRRESDGLTYGIAWAKMLGTGIISGALAFNLERFFPSRSQWPFMYLLFAAIFALDVLYIVILARARRSGLPNGPANGPANGPPVTP